MNNIMANNCLRVRNQLGIVVTILIVWACTTVFGEYIIYDKTSNLYKFKLKPTVNIALC